jgi:hypothetical protein
MLSALISSSYAESGIGLSKGQSVYVPVYSHIYIGDRETRFLLAATLSIRNTDMAYPITIFAADYYNSDGKLLKKYIENPIRLEPLSSARYIVRESDKTGGSGASFIVRWKSDNPVNVPIIESVMIGTGMQQGISFTSRGQPITEHNP